MFHTQRKALLYKSTALAERKPYLCKGYSPCCCRGTTQRTRWIAKWKELQLKRLLNDQQLYAAATAGVRRKQGKMPATNKQEISCRYVHVHALFSMCADCATCTGTRCQPRGKWFLRVKVSLARTKHTRWAMYLRVDGPDHAAEMIS